VLRQNAEGEILHDSVYARTRRNFEEQLPLQNRKPIRLSFNAGCMIAWRRSVHGSAKLCWILTLFREHDTAVYLQTSFLQGQESLRQLASMCRHP
jgi:hypothetical protein